MIRASLEKKEAVGEIFNCGRGEATTINQLAELIIKASGKHLKPTYTTERQGDIKHSYADISKSIKLLKFKPNIKLEPGLRSIINFKQ